MRKESAIFKCDICGKEEVYSGPDEIINYDTIKNWHFKRRLIWNDYFSVPLDFCHDCFNAAFGEDATKEKAVSIFKRFFMR